MAEVALAAAGIVLSPILQVFFERMASHDFDDFFWGRKLNDKLLRKLKIALLSMKEWLHELKDVVYDVKDILDEIATKHL
jgi:hypothetical protein